MNYKESKEILAIIEESENIVLNCHISADADSLGSALSMYHVLRKQGKSVRVISPGEFSRKFSFLPGVQNIEVVDFSKYDFSKHDLFLCLDSSSYNIVTGSKSIEFPKIRTIIIDHHKVNTLEGEIKLVDANKISLSEVLYLIFADWGIKVDKVIGKCLLTGMIGDSGAFQYPGTTSETFEVASDLLNIGIDMDEIIFHLFRSKPFSLLKFWGDVLKNIKVDKKYKFVWTAIPYKLFKKHKDVPGTVGSTASMFFETVDGTDFGVVVVEQKRGYFKVSFRSRTGFDVSKIAKALGGAGHQYAAGAILEDMSFQGAVDKVLSTARDLKK
jgi:phosphoesterase RecJ-like protein